MASDVGGWSGVAHRRLVLTHAGLLERRPGDYEVGCPRGSGRMCGRGAYAQYLGVSRGLVGEAFDNQSKTIQTRTGPTRALFLLLWVHRAARAAATATDAQPCWIWPGSQVAEWRQLPAIAALVRFVEDPQWLAVEWADGTPTATYVTPARSGP